MNRRIWTLISLGVFIVGITFVIVLPASIVMTAAPSTAQTFEVEDAPLVSTADMRQVAFITTHGAPRTPENPTGLRRQLIDPDDGYRWLFDQFMSRKFARFIVHQPAGWMLGEQMPAAQHWPMDDAHIDMWERAIRDAMRKRPEITIGFYGSLKLKFTHSIDMGDWHRARFNDPRDRWAIWQQCIAPWVRAGAYEYWFDNSSAPEARRDAVLFSEWLADTHAVRVGIEAFPTFRRVTRPWALDYATMSRAPSLATLAFVRNLDPNGSWDVNDVRYEAIVWVFTRKNERAVTLDELTSLLRRGFVLGVSGEWTELVLEAYESFKAGRVGGS